MTLPVQLPPESLSALVDASAAINSARGLDDTLAAIARAAAAVMQAEASSVILLDEARGKQVFRAAVGDRADQLLGLEYDRDLGISGKVVQSGEAVIISDARKERAHLKDMDALLSFQTRSLIAVPLTHKGAKLGVVEVINPLRREKFSEEDLELCRIFANLAAIAAANAQLYDRLQRDHRSLKQSLPPAPEMIGTSPALEQVRAMIRRVAPSSSTVLLLGPTGTGKELAARLLHAQSPRAERAFIAVNCAALPETLLESELFGHEPGAFTGAAGRKLGRFELADGGTLFLDEIGEIAPSIQVKLLRAIQEKEIVRVGGTKTVACDVRIIAATNRRLEDEMRAGRFRQDLYYRLNVFPIPLPPLRERREDIPILARHIVSRLALEMKARAPAISSEAMAVLLGHDYPGNVRELQNLLERACLLCCLDGGEGVIRPEHLPRELAGVAVAAQSAAAHAAAAQPGAELASGNQDPAASGQPAGASVLADAEKTLVLNALQQNHWNQTRAAKALGISRDNLRYRVRKYGLKREQDRH